MAEKAKAKKAKPLAKKTAAARPKKKEISVKDAYHETDAEELQLAQEELPKRGTKSSTKAAAEKKALATFEKEKDKDKTKAETKSVVAEEKPAKAAAPQIIAPRVVIEKPVHEPRAEKPRHEAPRHEPKQHSQHSQHSAPAQRDGLNIRISESLVKKLKDQAADEGISLEEFITELLAESVVLRAWEIVERKNAMKGGHNQGQGVGGRNFNNQNQGNKGSSNQRGGNNNNNNQGGGGHKGNRMNHARYQSIMDDKATFLEYVRNQEKNRR